MGVILIVFFVVSFGLMIMRCVFVLLFLCGLDLIIFICDFLFGFVVSVVSGMERILLFVVLIVSVMWMFLFCSCEICLGVSGFGLRSIFYWDVLFFLVLSFEIIV